MGCALIPRLRAKLREYWPLTAALLTWLVVVTLLDLFFMALGTFCAMITGWLLAVPVLYGVANALALIVTWLGQQLASLLLIGYATPDATPRLTVWLTPVYRLIQELGQIRQKGCTTSYSANIDYPSGLTPEGWQAVLVYAAAALVLLALSRLLYARRKSELSGDPAAFPWMRGWALSADWPWGWRCMGWCWPGFRSACPGCACAWP